MSDIEKQVCQDIKRRQQLGIKKYGTTVADNNLSLAEWLEHAYQECLDQAIYLKRAMAEVRQGEPEEKDTQYTTPLNRAQELDLRCKYLLRALRNIVEQQDILYPTAPTATKLIAVNAITVCELDTKE